MKFVISKNVLDQALNTVSKAVSGKNARPILSCVKLEMNNHGLFLTASDANISIVTKIPLEDDNGNILIALLNPGIAVLPARNISDVIRKLSGERLEIEMIEESILRIKDEISDFSLNCMDANEYPLIDINIVGTTINLSTKDLINGVNQTSYAASDKDTRPILEGVNVHCDGNSIEFIATDGFRIARKQLNMTDSKTFSVTIPSKMLDDVAKIAESDDNVEMTVCEKRVSFKFTNTLVIASILNGSFPDVSRLIPPSFAQILTIASSDLLSSIDRTSILSADRGSVVRFSMSTELFNIKSRSQETGSANDTIKTFEYSGSPLEISFTARYITDALKAMPNGLVKIQFNGDDKPAIISSSTDNSLIALILPVRTY